MKLNDFNSTELGGDEFEGKDIGINTERMGFIFDLLSSQIYRRPIESIVRELTSNCFDSHVEANVDDPVVIRIAEDDAGEYISFIDVGVGLSPDRIDKIYTNLGESTKRQSNEFIGGFGMGSKSPFSYTDSFFINTNFDGTRTEYLMSKTKNGVPKIEKLLELETLERNGTEIRINFLDTRDTIKFHEACKKELIYFDNVYFDVQLTYLGELNNNYVIYDRPNYKFRPDAKYMESMHICLGKVCYPIDWNALGVNPIKLPIAVKFKIGDLVVTPERESIRYTNFINSEGLEVDTVSVIKAKIEQIKTDLIATHSEQIDKYEEDLVKFDSDRYTSTWLTFGEDVKLNIANLVQRIPLVFSPLEDFLGELPTSLLFEYQLVGEISNGKVKLYENSIVFKVSNFTDFLVVRYPATGKFQKKKSLYLQDLVADMKIPVRGKILIINKSPVKKVRSLIDLFNIKYRRIDLSKTNLVKQIQLYRNVMRDEVIRRTMDYENVEVPQDWIDKYNAANRKGKQALKEEEFIVYNYGTPTPDRQILTTVDLKKFTGFLVYGAEEDDYILKQISYLLRSGKYTDRSYNTVNHAQCRIYKTAKKNYAILNKFKHSIHVSDFMGDNKVFTKIATALMVEDTSEALAFRLKEKNQYGNTYNDMVELLKDVFPPVADALKELREFCTQYGIKGKVLSEKLDRSFRDELIAMAQEQGLYKQEILDLSARIDKYLQGLNLIQWLDINEKSFPYLLKFFKLNRKKLSGLWDDPDGYEYQLILELIEKAKYQMELQEQYSIKANYYRTLTIKDKGLLDYHYANEKRDIGDMLKKKGEEARKVVTLYNLIETYHGIAQENYA